MARRINDDPTSVPASDEPDEGLGRISVFEGIAFTVGLAFIGVLASGVLNAMLPWNA